MRERNEQPLQNREGRCKNCGAPSTGAVNGLRFCSQPVCINKVMAVAFQPIKKAVKKVQP
jgi:hypothetical protein